MVVDCWKKEREHFEQLRKKHNIRIEYVYMLINNPYINEPAFQAYAIPWEKTIRIPEINSAANYTAALHELGHCVGPGGNPWDVKYRSEHRAMTIFDSYFTMPSVVKIELAAWTFAIQNALPSIWDCETAIANASASYASYYEGATKSAAKWGRKIKLPSSRNKYSRALLTKDAKKLASLSKLA